VRRPACLGILLFGVILGCSREVVTDLPPPEPLPTIPKSTVQAAAMPPALLRATDPGKGKKAGTAKKSKKEKNLPAGWYGDYAQALAKVERGHTRDLADVRAMVARHLIQPREARDYFSRIEPDLYRFPAIDGPTFRRAVDEAFPP